MKAVAHWIAAGAVALLWCAPVSAQRGDAGGLGGTNEVPAGAVLRASERTAPIQIDGVLGDEGWRGVEPITQFVQGTPVQGAAPERRTEVRLVFDDEAIYVGARMVETPSRIARQLVRRDEAGQADYFEVMFDPNRDRRTGYRFRLTAAGVQGDTYLFEDSEQDDSWDAVWESDVSIDENGWSAEMRIPWSQIRYEPGDGPQTWGINFVRWRVEAGEMTYHALVPRDQHGRVSFFRPITGVRVPGRTRRIEVRPYVLARAHTGPASAGNPFFDGSTQAGQAGFDLRYGLGSAFTLDATMNPDFGQVELDPAVINLSAFETFFPERRPFFVEDARILDFTLSGHQNMLFYSRRIGRSPRGGGPDDAAYVDVPDQSTIAGAAKLTGRTSNGLSVGALAAMSAPEDGRAYLDDAGGGEIVDFLAEPRGYFGVVRVQQDLREGGTTVGGIVTGMRRDLPSDGGFDFLPSDAYSAGLDFEHMWGDREWALQGFWAGSLVRGDPEALVRIQESSNHYFQRPDAEVTVDSAATSLAGAEWRLEFARRSGEHWTGAAWLGEVTPGFEINDLGYSRSTERLDAGVRLAYREIRPGRLFREYSLSAWSYHNWRHEALDDAFSISSWGHAHKAGSLLLSGRGTLNSFWGGSFRVSYESEVLDDGATRGGPLMVEPSKVSTNLQLHTDRRDALTVNASVNYAAGDAGHSLRGGLGVTVRPTPGWEVQIEPSATKSQSRNQYVTSFDDEGFAPTYGRRYLFGDLDRTSLGLETRLNVTFSPTLTLQLFAQPLIEAGEYTAYKQLAAAESFDFRYFEPGTPRDSDSDGAVDRCTNGGICSIDDAYYLDFNGDGVVSEADRLDDRDFNLVSLRGNAVLRWEYRPGSTLFLVWQQRRSDYRTFGDFDLNRDGGDLLGLHPDNVFMLKLNYWLGV